MMPSARTADAGTPGASAMPDRACRFRVWAPRARRVEVLLRTDPPRAEILERGPDGVHEAHVPDVAAGTRYTYRLHREDGVLERPDPASRHQPDGVHGPSAVTAAFDAWTDDAWTGLDRHAYVFYEMHVGTCTEEGTLDAAIGSLDDLADLGVTAVELMPVAQFAGRRNWGYDAVFPWAVHQAYGGPAALSRFVDAAHARGIAVVLDVVHNHAGPEGDVLADFAPYYKARSTPWGPAPAFDGPHAAAVRDYYIGSVLHFMHAHHVDAFRLDAVHEIHDASDPPFLRELAQRVHDGARALGRRVRLFPEDVTNNARLVRAPAAGGLGHDAVWNEDYHHALHALVTGERGGYYADYGTVEALAQAVRDGFVFTGQDSLYYGPGHGQPADDLECDRFIAYAQNHDQAGNRPAGDRLSTLLAPDALRLVAATVITGPYLPLLFMGEEYGETRPFPFFVHHGDPATVEATRRGRRAGFRMMGHAGDAPDPYDPATFQAAKLAWHRRGRGGGARLVAWYRALLRTRRDLPALARPRRAHVRVASTEDPPVMTVVRAGPGRPVATVHHFGATAADASVVLPDGAWRVRLRSPEDPGEADTLESDGRVRLRLPPYAFLLLEPAT